MLEAPTLWDLIEARADATPDATMVIDESGQTITFVEYRDRCLRCAAGLQDMGIGTGTVVSWQLPTWIESMVLIGALSRLGAIQNPIIPIYREREVGFIAKQAAPKLLIVPPVYRDFDHAGMAHQIAAQTPGLEVMVCDKSLPEGDPSSLAPFEPSSEIRWLFYTSGTTADPKGAQHTDATVMAAARGMLEAVDLQPDDRTGLVFPLTHIGGVILLIWGLRAGSVSLITDAFNPATTIPFLKREGVTIAGSGTYFHMAYLAAQRADPSEKLFPNLRCCPGGGAPKPPQLHYDIRDEMGGIGVVSGYGMTEVGIITMGSVRDPEEKLALTEGRPTSVVDLKLVTLDGHAAGPGEEGEIRVKGPAVMKGYLDDSLNAEAFDAEGYLRTGDLGRLDEDGYLVITGRVKDIIIRKGENISAKEVEDILFTHPKIADVAVIGLPDPSSGERACAVVVSKAEGDALSMDEMRDYLKDKGLRMQAIPEQIEIVDALPRNPAGKVLKQDLKKVYA